MDAAYVCKRIAADKSRLKLKDVADRVREGEDYIEVDIVPADGGKKAEREALVETDEGSRYSIMARALKLKSDLLNLDVGGNPLVTRAVRFSLFFFVDTKLCI